VSSLSRILRGSDTLACPACRAPLGVLCSETQVLSCVRCRTVVVLGEDVCRVPESSLYVEPTYGLAS
jgi:RNA polymerase subunit RPABC4/transcription elongation factor Spt4